jgi:predicted phage terminase large subunit-like protein
VSATNGASASNGTGNTNGRHGKGTKPGRVEVDLEQVIDPGLVAQMQAILAVKTSKYIPHDPWPKQRAFLWLQDEEALYGGAARGGKSDALLMGALQYADTPGYSALLIRRTYADLAQPGGLMDRAYEWLAPTAAQWNGQAKQWEFPVEGSGPPAKLQFGYLDREPDKYRYQGGEYQYIGIDELTQLPWETAYTYLFSRLTRLAGSVIPVRMRAATNPGGFGGIWVRERFIPDPLFPFIRKPPFIPAFLEDNPAVDAAAYLRTLARLDPVEYQRLRYGDWFVIEQGEYFPRESFQFINRWDLPELVADVRGWDKAGTQGGGNLTAGVRIAADLAPRYFVLDFVHGQWGAHKRDKIIRKTAEADGRGTEIWIEKEGGSGGPQSFEISLQQLSGFNVHGENPTANKEARARPFSSQVQGRNVYIVLGPWNSAYLSYVCPFPGGTYKDPVDASSLAFNHVAYKALMAARSRNTGDEDVIEQGLYDYAGYK